METDRLPPQSDDSYERVAFLNRATGEEVPGVMGWREGTENRVAFQVWDGPSSTAVGDDLAAAFAAARAGIVRAGFTPLAPDNGGPDGPIADLFASLDDQTDKSQPRFAALLWVLFAIILLAILVPALARAEAPKHGQEIAFPNAPFTYRIDGPDIDPRANFGFERTLENP